MLVILEGPEGVGKTTLAQNMSDRHGFLRYRMMAHGGRMSSAQVAGWHALDVPVNTYAEDIFIADMLWALSFAGRDVARVVLDRSIISGLAYAHLPLPGGTAETLTSFWTAKMSAMSARIVYMDASDEQIASRLQPGDDRRHPEHLARVRSRLGCAMRYASSLPVLRIDTTSLTPSQVLSQVEGWLDLPSVESA